MQRPLTDLAGLSVTAEDFLAVLLEGGTQPIALVDSEGVIRFANPPAVAALGYDRAEDLVGRPGEETIHSRHTEGPAGASGLAPMLRGLATGETVRSELAWFCRRDGSMFPASYVSVPIAMADGRGAVVAFTDIRERRRAQQVLREHDAVLAQQQASLRRVAAVVAQGTASAEVFAAIAREVGRVLEMTVVNIWRFERDGTMTVMGTWSERRTALLPGTNWSLAAPPVVALAEQVKAGRTARIDVRHVPDALSDGVREIAVHACAGAPIVVGGEVWGMMAVGTSDRAPVPDHVTGRLAEITELVATTIANAESRAGLERLAEEQAALRRVATLVAEGVSPTAVFDAVAREMEGLLDADQVALSRYEPDEEIVVVAHRAPGAARIPPGTRVSHAGQSVTATVRRSERPARVEHFQGLPGEIPELARTFGIRVSVGAPIVVDGRLWGVIIASWLGDGSAPPDTEERMAQFAQLLETAIAKADSRDQLTASRARLLSAGDEARRRVVRDLHDGAQQRLVHTIVTLQLAQRSLSDGVEEAEGLVEEALGHAQQSNAELRELVHGILPAALTHGGLKAAVDVVVARLDLPIDVDVTAERFPAEIEATAYFIVAEALTNVVKHADASQATVAARVDDGILRIEIQDDGNGGARPEGSGLLGLADRVAVFDGHLRVESPANGGTLVAADIPVK